MEIKIIHSLSPETASLLKDLINAIRPQSQTNSNTAEATPIKNYLPFTEPDTVPAKAPKEPVKEPTESTEADINIATIRALVKEKADAGLKSEIKDLLTEHGAANVSQLKPSAYRAFFNQLQNL